MKNPILIAFFILVFAISGSAQQDCKYYSEPAGAFSFCPPASWAITDNPGQKYKKFIGPTSGNTTPNINIKEELASLSHDEYIALSLKNIFASTEKLGVTNLKLVYWNDFVTTSGERGTKYVLNSVYKGYQVRSVQYIFNAPGNLKLLFTATSFDPDTTTEGLADTAVKTLLIKK